ncbi:glycosyltransferase family 4 protein [Aetokthonos hydrillicola Thurmond2011]|jgi:glycosyltransferase involved in cell wall biosynthesis|uniref:Glycosyltransferase family 4 protein n=1 Tax=Aetokthonos hydrillicola Thurmond2011 TaxID=2712845 RepID=A0AAP5M8G7_9CYAN|nr:glycosyltransferase family 4 protein [Aetokthonos hydrillicola]MBO3461301.1 glycosyltransferase family 4 protein [Aetokthonos hydrillicola CCALA 1050]MBW4589639.1 glycosyltransferase family 4 protein [Aetokthonos hydrillicola CCALA 1050]MDR9899136.1 glycosyltransferase family 4 protein [Aetokthonos hydrillicola Thurmond2011]
MNILHVVNHLQEIGNGIVNVAVDLASLQAKGNHNVAVASAGGEYERLLKDYGIKHYRLDQARTPLNIVKAARNYREIVHEFQPDIVHAHMMTGVVLAAAMRNSSYGLVSTVHNEFQRSAVLMGLADRVIAVSKAVADSMIRRGIPEKKLRVVPNGTLGSPRSQRIQDYKALPLQRPAITTVAGMYQRKGIGELIDAFVKIANDFPQAHLYLVGNGPDRAMFETKAQKTAFSDRIHFEGFQPNPQRYMLSTDIFVLASYNESFGLVLTEAREAGCAIIASDVDGIPETLDNRQAGILVPPKDSHALADALAELLSDPSKLEKWRCEAAQNLERFSVARVTEETLNVYNELLSNCGAVRVTKSLSEVRTT